VSKTLRQTAVCQKKYLKTACLNTPKQQQTPSNTPKQPLYFLWTANKHPPTLPSIKQKNSLFGQHKHLFVLVRWGCLDT